MVYITIIIWLLYRFSEVYNIYNEHYEYNKWDKPYSNKFYIQEVCNPETTVTFLHNFYKKSPLFRIFLIALRGTENVKCFWGWNFFIHSWESGKEWFCPFKLFSKLKQHSVNIEHQLKSKLEWPACIKYMKLKLKWHRRSYKAGTSEVFIGL